ncbi:MAG: aldose 1-epimerase family protein [Verrucomicrobiae bacterium]|nr:aldose 1-epimerase family protein [Verrucomicrobiae bacterium]
MPTNKHTAKSNVSLDPNKFENIHQIGGIRTATLDCPAACGGRGVRVALVDTGAGLRFTVALDRGGDIVDARYNQFALAYLSPNELLPPSHAYHSGIEWLHGWAGGLVTTCGPQYVGGPREEDGVKTSLHGRYSNQPAAVEQVINPDPQRGQLHMLLGLRARDSRVFGPVIEVRRAIRCTLGEPEILIEDEVTNRANTRTAHNWLYHCNLGYPLLDQGARFVYRGRAQYWVLPPPPGQTLLQPLDAAGMNRLKRVPGALAEHAGFGERGLIVEVPPGRGGICHIGLLNHRIGLGLGLSYPAKAMPRMAHWQHFGPRGAYVSGLEPFCGSLIGKALDTHRAAAQYLEPGESRHYWLKIRVLATVQEQQALADCDGPVTP